MGEGWIATADVWTRATGEPRHLGKLVLVGNQVRFTYNREAGDLPGLSLVHDTAKLAGETFAWPSTEENPLPPMLQALVPPVDGRNLQRRILTRMLERRGVFTARGPDLEWELLLLEGRNAIGHLDVFTDNTVAQAWYQTPLDGAAALDLDAPPLLKLASETLQGTLSARTIDEIIEIAELHPTSGGAMPKVLLPISAPEHNQPVDALVKFQGEEYPDVIRLEHAAYGVFERISQAVPERWMTAAEDAVLLATRRFDRADGPAGADGVGVLDAVLGDGRKGSIVLVRDGDAAEFRDDRRDVAHAGARAVLGPEGRRPPPV